MKNKKIKFKAIERKRFIFLEIGMIVTLSVILLAFNYRTYDSRIPYDNFFHNDPAIEDMTPITIQPPKPPVPPPQVPLTIINIIDDGEIVIEDVFIDVGADENTEIPDFYPEPPKEENVDEILQPYMSEVEPSFPGGESARIQFLRDNVKYPQSAREMFIQGIVYLRFVVEPDGSITNIEIARGIGFVCDQEALRVMSLMPKWYPGMQNDKAVRVQFTMPIRFVLK
nr:energy transducer TonB [Bacteroidota bacterium]